MFVPRICGQGRRYCPILSSPCRSIHSNRKRLHSTCVTGNCSVLGSVCPRCRLRSLPSARSCDRRPAGKTDKHINSICHVFRTAFLWTSNQNVLIFVIIKSMNLTFRMGSSNVSDETCSLKWIQYTYTIIWF